MKQGKDKVVRKRYMTGTSIRNIIEDPSTALAKNDINIAKAQYAGASNPFVIGLDMLGNLTTQAGAALGGFENIEGINPNLAKVLNAGLPAITQGLQYLGDGGTVQKKDATNVKVRDKIKPVKEKVNLPPIGTIEPATDDQIKKMKRASDWEKFTSDLYVNERIAKAKKAISGVTAATSYIPNPVGAVSAGINFGIDAIDAITDPNFYNKFNATTGGIKATGTSNILRRFGKYGRLTDDVLDRIGYLDSGQDIYEALKTDKEYATGGQINSNVPVEVEGGEAGELPNGQLLNFSGPSHSKGGIPIDLPEGTEIYSKRIKIDGESMADRKLKREGILARYTKKAKKLDDAISSNTLNRVKKIVDIQEEEDKKVQQIIHDMTTGVVNTGNQVIREKHWDGNTVGDMTDIIQKSKYDAMYDLYDLEGSRVPNIETEALKTPALGFINVAKPNINLEAILSNTMSKIKDGINNDLDKTVKNNYDLPLVTPGDALNIAGNIFQGVAPYLNTLNQRATDTPNVNAFKNYGEEGINKMAQSENYLKQIFDSRLKDIGLKRSDAIKRGRNSTGSVNLMRALDTNADMAANTAENEIYDKYAAQMMDILSKEAQLENEQDKVVMSGEQARDLADRQDKDAFYTAKGEGLRNIGMTTANAGKQANEILTRNSQFNILNSMYENFGINPITGQVYGKLAKAMNLKDGDIPTPSAIDAYIKSGVDPRIKTKEDYYKIYGLTNPNPINNITVGTKDKGGKK